MNTMNKSALTNIITLALLIGGYFTNHSLIFNIGLFAFSGAVTNWLAVHMLFEKVPGLYGSGIIPARFEEFKSAIKKLMMEQFFTDENMRRFINQELAQTPSLDPQPIIEKIDFNPTFDSLLEVIANSSFGGMLAMFGGTEILTPLKEPFVEKISSSIVEISQTDAVKQAIQAQITTPTMLDDIHTNIEAIIDLRLSELTPQLIKEIVQQMIKQHLGWLVVWGGVFGGLIGLINSVLM